MADTKDIGGISGVSLLLMSWRKRNINLFFSLSENSVIIENETSLLAFMFIPSMTYILLQIKSSLQQKHANDKQIQTTPYLYLHDKILQSNR